MTYRVRSLRIADRDLKEALGWMIEERGAARGAESWLRAFDSARRRLAENPSTFALAPEDELFDFEVRECFFGTRRGLR